MTYRRIDEHVIREHRLGRHVNHDPRSLLYLVKPRAALARSVLWTRQVPILDQGNVGSCVGNGVVGCLGSDPIFDTLADFIAAGLKLDEPEALDIYTLATQLDEYAGEMPGEDTGSDGLSGAKAALQRGLISGYLHCTSIDAVITALQDGAVITGVNWYEGFDHPDSSGRVTISGGVRGGHEFVMRGVDLEDKFFVADNSWSDRWGVRGSFTFGFDDYARLLGEQGDATKLLPLTVPAPTPTPVPNPTPPSPQNPDFLLVPEAKIFTARNHRGANKKMSDTLKVWLHAKGYDS